jgi:propionate CoA-transferase
MELRDDMLRLPLEQRFTYDPKQNLFFVNFERLPVRSRNDIRAIKENVEAKIAPLGHKVYAIVNYDNFSIVPELLDEYSAMVRGLMDHYYTGVSRYTTSGFLRMKLGESLERRGVAAHIFESAEEAQSDLRDSNWP